VNVSQHKLRCSSDILLATDDKEFRHVNESICVKTESACRAWLDKRVLSPWYSHAPHKDVSVNDGQDRRRWSHKII